MEGTRRDQIVVKNLMPVIQNKGVNMGYIYKLINQDNGKIFLGKSNLDKKTLKKLLFQSLRKKKHYNDLLQKDFIKHPFKLIFKESDSVLSDFDTTIKKEKLLNPIYGYNMFNDLQNKKGKGKKTDVYTEDLCLLFLFFPRIQFWSRVTGIQRNVLSNRLSNFKLFGDDYYTHKIARYEDFFYTAMRLLFLEEKCMKSNILLDTMINRYEISTQLRVTPRKISKFFISHDIGRTKEKERGTIVFCPKRKKNVSEED